MIINISDMLGASVAGIQRAGNFSPDNTKNDTNDHWRLLDYPLVLGISSFGSIIWNLRVAILSICQILCMVNILFQAFKLWFGVQEVKKFYVDAIWKTVSCIALLALYPTAVDGVMTIATSFGMRLTNGYNNVNDMYKKATATLYTGLSDDLKVLVDAIKANTITSGGQQFVGDGIYDAFKKTLTKDEVNTILTGLGIEVATKTELDDFKYYYLDSHGKEIPTLGTDDGVWEREMANKTAAIKKSVKKKNKKEIKLAASKIRALNKVVTGEDILAKATEVANKDGDADETAEANADAAKEEIKNTLFAPFLKDANGKETNILAPSQMIRTILTFGDAITLASAYDETAIENAGTKKDDGGLSLTKVFNPDGKWLWPAIKKLIYTLIFDLGLAIAVIILIADYSITVLEYYIVTSLGALLIPLMFLDSTKEYTKNLLRLFMQYFFKIMVQSMAIMFTISMYLNAVQTVYLNLDCTVTTVLVSFIGTLLIGLFLCGGASKMAGGLLSGQPSMSLGDMAHQAHHMIAAGKMAGSLAEGLTIGYKNPATGKREGGMLGAIRGGIHAKQNLGAIGQGKAAAKDAGMNKFDDAAKAGGGQYYSGKQLESMKNGTAEQQAKYNALRKEAGERSAEGFTRHAVGQWIKNAAYKKAMGEEKITDDQSTRFTGIGSQTADENGERQRTANTADMRNIARKAGEAWGGGGTTYLKDDGAEQRRARSLGFFQPPKEASPITFGGERNASMDPGYGDRKDGGTGI